MVFTSTILNLPFVSSPYWKRHSLQTYWYLCFSLKSECAEKIGCPKNAETP
jgi:hypothetical protein